MLTQYDSFFAERALLSPLFDPFASLLAPERLWFGLAMGRLPPTDVVETSDAIEIVCDLPGARPGEVEVDAHDGYVTLRGWRAGDGVASAFERTFHLGGGYAFDAASASFDRGVLRVRVPKAAAARPERILVRAEEADPSSTEAKPGPIASLWRRVRGFFTSTEEVA
jgi:HSP20 family protein